MTTPTEKLDIGPSEGKKESWVCLKKKGIDPHDKGQWAEQHAWLIGTLEKFYEVFAVRVRDLDANEYQGEEELAED